jgi:hypothetical protein
MGVEVLCPRCWARAERWWCDRLGSLSGGVSSEASILYSLIDRSSSPFIGSDLPIYFEVGRVQGGLGELSLRSTCARVQEDLTAASCGLQRYCWYKINAHRENIYL